ncbi:uncharacterized GPI-anchored protein At4g28100 [Rhodamnia argentea]|uniref:Uncharacterized GPI-anchored protein At4g28100 n=1 Tax=Rhodamnia argentea TaxID=178133 RepID=A0A8B8PMB9_9MYRT|nr:uncharacterized GPI-anchored protein At4g28100 [Rhodamnia argentea]
MSLNPAFSPSFLISILLSILLPALSATHYPDPEPAIVQPLHVNPSPPATIPAFPEQSDAAGCPLDLPDELFRGVRSACGGGDGSWGELRRTRCCPVLAAWLFSAYSSTALGRAGAASGGASGVAGRAPAYDMPLLPDDSETCVDGLGKAFRERGVELARPNETCDVVYCYCGIRLHPLSCPGAFSVTQRGRLVGDESVRRLERDCRSGNGFPGLGGCSKCLNSLHQLNQNTSYSSKLEEDRTTKMRNKDCQLMGLTWLLAKNRTAYIHTVSAVLRALMTTEESSSDPQLCTLSSDGMPLAVDSSEISGSSSLRALRSPFFFLIASPLALSLVDWRFAV